MHIADTETKVTVDMATIQNWVNDRAGLPAVDEAGRITVFFPPLEPHKSAASIPWKEFERRMNDQALAFIYKETTPRGAISRYFKLVPR